MRWSCRETVLVAKFSTPPCRPAPPQASGPWSGRRPAAQRHQQWRRQQRGPGVAPGSTGGSSDGGDQPLAADSPAALVERAGERVLAYSALSALLGVLGLTQVALPQQVRMRRDRTAAAAVGA